MKYILRNGLVAEPLENGWVYITDIYNNVRRICLLTYGNTNPLTWTGGSFGIEYDVVGVCDLKSYIYKLNKGE